MAGWPFLVGHQVLCAVTIVEDYTFFLLSLSSPLLSTSPPPSFLPLQVLQEVVEASGVPSHLFAAVCVLVDKVRLTATLSTGLRAGGRGGDGWDEANAGHGMVGSASAASALHGECTMGEASWCGCQVAFQRFSHSGKKMFSLCFVGQQHTWRCKLIL